MEQRVAHEYNNSLYKFGMWRVQAIKTNGINSFLD